MPTLAQDVIFKQDGNEIQCKLIEVGPQSVKYKRWTNLNGPTYIEERDNIFMIKYENGEKDVFGVKSKTQPSTTYNPALMAKAQNLAFDKHSVSGLTSNGNEIQLIEAQSIMGEDWNDFKSYKNKRKAGKALLISGFICRFTSTGMFFAAVGSGEIPCHIIFLGLRTTSIPLTTMGIVKLAKGQRGCNRLVQKHNSSSMGFNPEFNIGVGPNAMSLKMNF